MASIDAVRLPFVLQCTNSVSAAYVLLSFVLITCSIDDAPLSQLIPELHRFYIESIVKVRAIFSCWWLKAVPAEQLDPEAVCSQEVVQQ